MEFDFAVCFAVPAIVAWSVSQLRRFKWFRWGAGATGLAVALGWLSAYWVLVSNSDWWPSRTWHWLPYLSLLAGVTGAIGVGEKWSKWLRIGFAGVMALFFAFTMIPNWPGLWPSREILIGSLVVYAVGLTGWMMWPEYEVATAKRQLIWMAVALLGLTIAGLAGFGMTYAQLALIGASALTGVAVAMQPCGRSVAGLQAVILWYVLIAGGVAFTAAIYPTRPRFELMLLPLTPLVAHGLGSLMQRFTTKPRPLTMESLAAFLWLGTVLSIAILA